MSTEEETIDPKKLEMAARQQLMDRGIQEYAHALNHATGKPPMAVIVVVHWPEDIMFASTMASAAPQAQMNAIDAMLKHLSTVGQKLKAAVNAVRHGAKPNEAKH